MFAVVEGTCTRGYYSTSTVLEYCTKVPFNKTPTRTYITYNAMTINNECKMYTTINDYPTVISLLTNNENNFFIVMLITFCVRLINTAALRYLDGHYEVANLL